MRGDTNNPFVYQYRDYRYGSYTPSGYGYTNRYGKIIGGHLDSVFMGKEQEVRERIKEGSLPALPWHN